MKVRGKGATLIGAEGETPPLPYIELDDVEALALIARGVAVAIDGEVVAEATPAPIVEPAVDPVVVQEPAHVEPAATVEPVIEEPDERRQVIADAIVLLSDDELVKTGPRAGKPLVKVLEAATGLDLTAEEVDAVFDTIEVGQ